MHRIFLRLVVAAFMLLAIALAIGLSLGDVSAARDDSTRRWITFHFLSGVSAALFVVFVNSIVVTWFIGTSRWCREVAETYRLDREFIERSRRLKRKTFPFALAAMLAMVGVTSLGACADPGAALQLQPPLGLTWSTLHFASALAAIAFLAYASFVQWNRITEQRACIEEIMAEVRRIRVERGLEV